MVLGFVNSLFSEINDQTLSRISHITSVQFYSHSWFSVVCFWDEPYKSGLERGWKRMFDDGIHTTTPAEVLKKKKKWNKQSYYTLKHQTNVLGVKVNIIIPILRFRFWGQGMCFHPCCIWYCNLWCSNRKRCSPGSLQRAAPFLFPSPPVKYDNCYNPRFLCFVYLNIRLYWRLNVDAYLKQ